MNERVDRLFRVTIIAAFAATLSGCCCVRGARGPGSICEVHQTAMRSEVIRAWSGCALAPVSYVEARQKFFPHAYPDQLSSPWPWRRERIYICDECIRAREDWFGRELGASDP